MTLADLYDWMIDLVYHHSLSHYHTITLSHHTLSYGRDDMPITNFSGLDWANPFHPSGRRCVLALCLGVLLQS